MPSCCYQAACKTPPSPPCSPGAGELAQDVHILRHAGLCGARERAGPRLQLLCGLVSGLGAVLVVGRGGRARLWDGSGGVQELGQGGWTWRGRLWTKTSAPSLWPWAVAVSKHALVMEALLPLAHSAACPECPFMPWLLYSCCSRRAGPPQPAGWASPPVQQPACIRQIRSPRPAPLRALSPTGGAWACSCTCC
jgi:hypothetical protein